MLEFRFLRSFIPRKHLQYFALAFYSILCLPLDGLCLYHLRNDSQTHFCRGLDCLGKSGLIKLPIKEVLEALQDLIIYFHPPEEDLKHEDKQYKLRSLRNRQNLFKEEVRNSHDITCHGQNGGAAV